MDELIKVSQGVVKCDFNAIKARLADQLTAYANCVFTEDKKKEAKQTVADLRKEQKALETQIKEAKARYMAPFDEFAREALSVCNMYNEPILAINHQVEAFEAKRIEEKRERIKEIYAEMVDISMVEVLPLRKLYSIKWENATCLEKQIRQEMATAVSSVKEAFAVIKGMKSDKEADAIQIYLKGFNLTEAMTYLQNYEKQKAEILAREAEAKQRAEIERVKAEERAKIQAEADKAQAIEEAKAEARAEVVEMLSPASADGVKENVTYVFHITPAEEEALVLFLNSVGIDYDKMVF